MANKIICQPLGGLANRMRTVAGAIDLAQRLNRKLTVIWTCDETLNEQFSRLFAPIDGVEVVECRLTSLKYKLLWRYYKNVKRYKVLDDNFIIAHGKNTSEQWLNMLKDDNLYILSCQNATLTEDFSMFVPSNDLHPSIEPGEDVIGIHIRRTDNEMSVKYSPTHLFVEKIEEEISTNPQAKFYLATDDPQEENQLKERFGEHILTYQKQSLDRNDPQAIRDAAIDLFNLSRCKRIYGSYYSSFSDTAAYIGKTEKTVLKLPE